MNLHDPTIAARLRTRALANGPGSLETPELLVLLAHGITTPRVAVNDGVPAPYHGSEAPAVGAMRNLIEEAGHLRNVLHSPDVPAEVRLMIRSAIEVAARVVEPLNGEVITKAQDAFEFMTRWIGHEEREMFCALFLDNHHRVIAKEVLFVGSMSEAMVDPTVVTRRAVVLGAVAVLVGHQHPSMVPEPSRADIELTNALKKCIEAVGCRLLDHVVVGGPTPVSFAERGLM